MNKDTIRQKLAAYGLHIYQLANSLGIDRQTYYEWGYTDFKGHEHQIKQAIHELINNQKEDKDNAD